MQDVALRSHLALPADAGVQLDPGLLPDLALVVQPRGGGHYRVLLKRDVAADPGAVAHLHTGHQPRARPDDDVLSQLDVSVKVDVLADDRALFDFAAVGDHGARPDAYGLVDTGVAYACCRMHPSVLGPVAGRSGGGYGSHRRSAYRLLAVVDFQRSQEPGVGASGAWLGSSSVRLRVRSAGAGACLGLARCGPRLCSSSARSAGVGRCAGVGTEGSCPRCTGLSGRLSGSGCRTIAWRGMLLSLRCPKSTCQAVSARWCVSSSSSHRRRPSSGGTPPGAAPAMLRSP